HRLLQSQLHLLKAKELSQESGNYQPSEFLQKYTKRAVCRGAINTRSCSRFPGHLGCARVHTSARPAAPSRAAVLFMRSEGSQGAKVCKRSGPRGLDKAGLRHRSGRAAMDTADSADSANSAGSTHSPACPPPRSLCQPPAQPGYLSARIRPRALSSLAPCPPPAEPEDRLAPAHPHAPSTSALALCPLPLPVPSVCARS
ncbi:hypothetical protein A6R68_03365, partial [Neotoma lepida]